MRPERFKVISVDDEAIDTESMPSEVMIEYIRKRDINLITRYIKPGMKPTIYHVKAVPHSMWQSFVMAGGDHDDVRCRRAFMCGVEEVENLVTKDGSTITLRPEHKNAAAGGNAFTEAEINDRFFPDELLEIGSVIFRHSFLHPKKSVTWLLPSLCAERLGLRRFLSVVANPSTAETQTSSQPSETTAATSETASA
jgi:hypothetical protein